MEYEQYLNIKKSIHEILGIDLSYYKDQQMRRRLDAWLARTRQPSWEAYFRLIRTQREECARFRDYITINVSEFFRDLARWQTLESKVFPYLFSGESGRAVNSLRIWSAGCSIGAEAYSLAFLLNEFSPSRDHYLLATDLDRKALAVAQAGGPYTDDNIRNVSAVRVSRFFRPDGPPFWIKNEIVRKVRFGEQNLLSGRFESAFDLIVCRNVVIYFTMEAKDLLYRKFHQALRPGGILFLGSTEFISHPKEYGFDHFDSLFYVRQ